MATTLRLILGDQLNRQHSWFTAIDPDTHYLIAELDQETSYVRHHVQKICAFFSAMEQFSDELTNAGHQVQHLDLDRTANFGSLGELVQSEIHRLGATVFEYQQPDEYRLQQQLATLELEGAQVRCCSTEHFIIEHADLPACFEPGKSARMEPFYRKLRRKLNILMADEEPLGGQWNYDEHNRKKLNADAVAALPAPLCFSNNVDACLERLERHQVACIGNIEGPLVWPVNREQSLELLEFFCERCLPHFGRYQDAMTCRSPNAWSLYHSRLSFALNSKMLHPMEVVHTALGHFENDANGISLASIEGFVRQIIGWREFIRGIYWTNMPDYANLNELNASRPLPDFFWTGKTKMNCLSSAISQSLDTAYAHHIQRLMITGNFCLLTGIDPAEVDEWYLGIYVDAVEWVELPNTRGMSQFADGGLVGSKPYAAGGNYINKMSDYCSSCQYSVKQKSGPGACPMNSLYWHFMNRHRGRLEHNPRTAMVYRSWDKQPADQRDDILCWAEHNLVNLEAL